MKFNPTTGLLDTSPSSSSSIDVTDFFRLSADPSQTVLQTPNFINGLTALTNGDTYPVFTLGNLLESISQMTPGGMYFSSDNGVYKYDILTGGGILGLYSENLNAGLAISDGFSSMYGIGIGGNIAIPGENPIWLPYNSASWGQAIVNGSISVTPTLYPNEFRGTNYFGAGETDPDGNWTQTFIGGDNFYGYVARFMSGTSYDSVQMKVVTRGNAAGMVFGVLPSGGTEVGFLQVYGDTSWNDKLQILNGLGGLATIEAGNFMASGNAGIDAIVQITADPLLFQTVSGSATFTKGLLTSYSSPY